MIRGEGSQVVHPCLLRQKSQQMFPELLIHYVSHKRNSSVMNLRFLKFADATYHFV